MKYIIVLFFVFISLISCDGRDRVNKTNQDVLKEYNLLESFSENIQYIPETYTEIITDTTLDNGFRVKVKTYTEMQDNVFNEFTIDTIKYKFYYRNYTSKLTVFFKNSLILDETINKSYLNKKENKEFWNSAVLGGISIDEHNSSNNEVYISILYCIPESEICKDFKIIVDKKGNKTIKELETEPIH